MEKRHYEDRRIEKGASLLNQLFEHYGITEPIDIIFSGTGWKQGVDDATGETLHVLPYKAMGVPCIDKEIEGHHSRGLHLRKIDGKYVFVAPKVHLYEQIDTDADIVNWAQILMGALKGKVKRVIFTSGVGNLTEPIPLDPDHAALLTEDQRRAAHEELQTLHRNAWNLNTGFKFRPRMHQGDIGIITDMYMVHPATGAARTFLPFIHKLNDMETQPSVDAARKALWNLDFQIPKVTLAWVHGREFEGDTAKKMWAQYAHVAGMTGPYVIFAALENAMETIAMCFITNDAYEEHSHEDNDSAGERFRSRTRLAIETVLNA